jgi:TolB-like protein/Flp pilus assembly protein TadD
VRRDTAIPGVTVSGATRAVFLSYASEDSEAVQRIADAIRAARIEVWFDKSELRGGDAWDRRIRQHIKSCALFIPVISQHSEGRLEGYFRLEWRLAVERSLLMAEDVPFLVPVVLDGTPDKDAVVPDAFRAVQWTHLPQGDTPAEFLEHIRHLLSRQHPEATRPHRQAISGAVSAASVSHPARAWPKSLVPITAAILVAALATYLGLSRFWISKPALTAVRTAALPATQKSIAVLPFADLSEKHDQEYLADGIAEEVLNQLAKVPELRVIGRTSSFSFRGKNSDVREIGKALGARYLLEGSLRRSADQIRVTVQLLDAHNGSQRWSGAFEQPTADAFRIQQEIAVRTARALNLTIASYAAEASESVNGDAYDNYVRGLHELQELNEGSVDRALAFFTRAHSLDADFSKALEGIATAQLFICVEAWKDHRSACESAQRSADAAIGAAPRSPDAYATRAELRTVYDWDWAGAEADVHKAESLGGGERTEFAAARLAYALGDMDRARQFLDTIISRSPFDANAMVDRGFLVEYRAGRFQDAESWMRRGLSIAPNSAYIHFELGLILLAQGRREQALEEMEQLSPEDGRYEGLAAVYHALGRPKESDDALRQAVDYELPTEQSMLARLCAFRGELDRAFAYLDAAYENRDAELWYLKGDWLVSNLTRDPRYADFLRKMKLGP